MSADLLFRGGRIFTANPAHPFATTLAVTGDRITALRMGSDDQDLIDRHTEVVELGGRLLTPGFIDAHVHPVTSGLDRLRCSFEGCRDASDAIDKVAGYALENPGSGWLIGAGWSQAWFERGCPPKELLDTVVPDRPVLLWNTDGHGAWVNSRALEVAGVDRETPDPPDGRIERLDDGSPQGTLHEGAVELVSRHAPEDSDEDLDRGLERGEREMLSYGITGWQDAWVDVKVQDAYLRRARSGRLRGRVVGALWWERDRGMDQIEELEERRRRAAPGFRPTSVKLMLDGVAENFTASLTQPWLDDAGRPTGNTGKDFIDPETLQDIVTALDSAGFQCHFHAIGDRAVRNALDAVEAALDHNGPSDNRHHIAHIQVVHPDDVPRFARVGAVANAQPFWACNDDYQVKLTRPFLGPERNGWQYPFRSLLASGARMGMGSDWGVSTANVMEEIEVAVTRECDGREPLVAHEALSPQQALIAFTSGSAYINHQEREAGMLAEGMLADLAVLDRDPFHEGSFRETKVQMTILGGRVVHEAF